MGPAFGFLAAFVFLPPSAWAETPPPQPASGTAPKPGPQAGRQVTGKFDILEYDVDGNTVLSTSEIGEAVYPFLGEQRDTADVDKARAALEDAYHKHGFQTVQVVIPQQSVNSGIIHLEIIENPVGRLRVVGSKYHLPSAIKALAPSLAEGKVPNINDVQKDIVALNQQPDMKVTPHLASGQTPDTVDVDLQVEDHLPVHASVEINNQYTQGTTPLRLLSTVSYGNLWQLGHTISLSYQVAPERPSDAEIWSGSYSFPLTRTPLSFSLYGLHSDSNVPAVVGTNVIGRGYIFGANAILTLPGTETLYQSVTAGIARKDLSQNVVTNGEPSNAPVLYYPVALTYSANVQSGKATTQADASFNFALPGTGSTSPKFDAQRFEALPSYFYAKADLSRTQPLPAGAEAYGKIDGQITPDALLSSEQYSAGGEDSVRGYLEAEELGDYGAHATTELRSPSLATRISSRVNDLRFLVFFDGALLRLHQPLPDQASTFPLAGTGVGVRLQAFDSLHAAVDAGFPLVNGAVTQAGVPFIHFRVWSEL